MNRCRNRDRGRLSERRLPWQEGAQDVCSMVVDCLDAFWTDEYDEVDVRQVRLKPQQVLFVAAQSV